MFEKQWSAGKLNFYARDFPRRPPQIQGDEITWPQEIARNGRRNPAKGAMFGASLLLP
ncbi:MAG: hypothetical protein QHH75_14360 [Bacillota bacterium]|nr:hypothetical protein [Bacillota bacterium]